MGYPLGNHLRNKGVAMTKTIGILGAGASGIFTAITLKEKVPSFQVDVLEKTGKFLSKVRISGGGRCNVTHACFDPKKLVLNYPRGSKELLSAFTKFQPKDMIAWLEAKGVSLKVESDGRTFPVTDSSETIINCFMDEIKRRNITISTFVDIVTIEKTHQGFVITLCDGTKKSYDALVFATGSSRSGFDLIQTLGHTIEPLVPSLFTFNVPQSPYLDLSGISLQLVKITLENSTLSQTGPLLFTHWGFSGPCVLKLSAWSAKHLYDCNYQTKFFIDFCPDLSFEEKKKVFLECKSLHPRSFVHTENPFDLPKKLWKRMVELVCIEDIRLGMLSKKAELSLLELVHKSTFELSGKTQYKEEFVTCGGVKRKEVDFKTMESKIVKGLYFTGEVLDIDGVTGGFNFQNAWTTAWICSDAISHV